MEKGKIKVGTYEAKTRLPELLRGVQAGKEYAIMNRNVVIAHLVCAQTAEHQDREEVIGQIKTFMQKKLGQGVNIKALIEEGRT